MEVVVLEEALDALDRVSRGRTVSEIPGDRLLQLKGQLVLVATAEKVERVADPQQEVTRRLQFSELRLGENTLHREFAAARDLELDLRDPQGRVQVAQPALPFLHLGFEKVDGVSILVVTPLALREFFAHELVGSTRLDLAVENRLEFLGQRHVAADPTRIDERGLDLGIGGREGHAIAQAAHGIADLEAQIPELVENRLGDGLDVRRDLVRVEEEQVDVRERVHLPTAVAALRQDCAALVELDVALAVARGRRVEQEPDEPVDVVGVPLDERDATRPALVPLPERTARRGDESARRPGDVIEGRVARHLGKRYRRWRRRPGGIHRSGRFAVVFHELHEGSRPRPSLAVHAGPCRALQRFELASPEARNPVIPRAIPAASASWYSRDAMRWDSAGWERKPVSTNAHGMKAPTST